MRRTALILLTLWIAVASQSALASTSLSTGVVLPGWDQVRSGGLYDSARSILLDYARQAGVHCGLVDVHMKSNARLFSRSIHVDTWFSSSYTLSDLLNARDHDVILLERRFGSGEHLLLVVEADRSLILAAC